MKIQILDNVENKPKLEYELKQEELENLKSEYELKQEELENLKSESKSNMNKIKNLEKYLEDNKLQECRFCRKQFPVKDLIEVPYSLAEHSYEYPHDDGGGNFVCKNDVQEFFEDCKKDFEFMTLVLGKFLTDKTLGIKELNFQLIVQTVSVLRQKYSLNDKSCINEIDKDFLRESSKKTFY